MEKYLHHHNFRFISFYYKHIQFDLFNHFLLSKDEKTWVIFIVGVNSIFLKEGSEEFAKELLVRIILMWTIQFFSSTEYYEVHPYFQLGI